MKATTNFTLTADHLVLVPKNYLSYIDISSIKSILTQYQKTLFEDLIITDSSGSPFQLVIRVRSSILTDPKTMEVKV